MGMKVLVANRGEIACRIMKTLREMGLQSVGVFSDADADAPHVHLADEAVAIGEARAYLDIDKLLAVAEAYGAAALHPGYGFLSENGALGEACRRAKVTLIGPSPETLHLVGDKRAARALAERCGLPTVPGATGCDDLAAARQAARKVGYPILIKAALGGGGKGMRRVQSEAELCDAFESARREAKAAFHDEHVLVEKYLEPVRHIEVQVLGDGKKAIALGERECSLQRRHQKILEESPAAGLSEGTRRALHQAAVKLMESAGYSGAGTVEFLVDGDGHPYFLEVNARLQVEHPVTEMLFGLDIVRCQIEIALGGKLPEVPCLRGHAIEVRLNAEDPYQGFLPATGKVLLLSWPTWPNVRVDSGIHEGAEVSPHYDILLAKVIAWAPDREQARRRLSAALADTTILGVPTNQTFLRDLLDRDFFKRGATFTTTIENETWSAPPVPEAALALAQAELDKPRQHRLEGEGAGDSFSPWERLGPFRVTP